MKQKVKVQALIGALILSLSPAVFAQDMQDDAAFTCASAVNVMDCIKQTEPSAPKASSTSPTDLLTSGVPVNTQLLGWSGPLTAGIRYDNYLAWILDVGYAQQFYDTAAAFKLSAGLNELRANTTLGYAITPKQQIKLTYEYLSQNLPFDYASGTVNDWVTQNAFGGAYRYILDNGMVRALEAYGSYTKANSKELSDVEMYTDNILTQINQRRIAGGTEVSGGGSVTLTPLKNTIVKVGAGYSSVSFDTKWENNESNAVLAYNAELSRLLTPTTMISTGVGNTASSRAHTAKVTQILPWSVEAGIIGQYNVSYTDIPSSMNIGASLSYPAPKTYTNVFAEGVGKLKDWVEKPVLYHSRVLAIAEERLLQVQITTKAIPAASMPVGTTLSPPIQTSDYFFFTPDVFDKINYQILSITQQGNNNNTFPPSALNLQITPLDSYNAVLSSAAPVQASAMTPGQYIVTLQASGYRQGQVVSQVDNPANISIGQNTNLNGPTWSTSSNATLVPAIAGMPYSPGTNLRTLVVDNSGLSGGDSYSFTLIAAPAWLTLSADGQWLVSDQPVPTTAINPTPVTISVISTVSNKSPQSGAKSFNLTIQNSGTNPTWKSGIGALPSAVFAMPYLDANDENINLSSSTYITPGFPGDLTFQCTVGCDSNGQITGAAGVSLASNGLILGTPNNINQVSQTATFTVVATNAAGLASTPQNFTITINPNSANFVAIWNSAQPIFPNGVPTQTSNQQVDLTQGYVQIINPPGDQISNYALVKAQQNDCGTQITLTSAGILTAKPTAPTTTTCDYVVQVTSKATGNSVSLGEQTLKILAGPVWNPPLPPILTAATFDLTAPYHELLNSYVKASGTGLNFLLDNSKTQPGWIRPISTVNDPNYYLDGTPDKVSYVGNTYTVYVIARDSTSPNPPPSQALQVTVMPNSTLTLPKWNNEGLLPPFATYGQTNYGQSINPYPVDNYYSNPVLTRTKEGGTEVTDDVLTFSKFASDCDWLEMSDQGVLSNKPNSPVSGISPCSLEFTVTSKAAGTSTKITQGQLTMQGPAPIFKSGYSFESIQFSDNTTKLNLSNAISNYEYSSPGMLFQLDYINHPNQSNFWTIDQSIYLKRKANNNAGDVSNTPQSIFLAVTNYATGNKNPVVGTVQVTVAPDPNVVVTWECPSPFVRSVGSEQYIGLNGDQYPGDGLGCIQSFLSNSNHTLVTGDYIDMPNSKGAWSPSPALTVMNLKENNNWNTAFVYGQSMSGVSAATGPWKSTLYIPPTTTASGGSPGTYYPEPASLPNETSFNQVTSRAQGGTPKPVYIVTPINSARAIQMTGTTPITISNPTNYNFMSTGSDGKKTYYSSVVIAPFNNLVVGNNYNINDLILTVNTIQGQYDNPASLDFLKSIIVCQNATVTSLNSFTSNCNSARNYPAPFNFPLNPTFTPGGTISIVVQSLTQPSDTSTFQMTIKSLTYQQPQ